MSKPKHHLGKNGFKNNTDIQGHQTSLRQFLKWQCNRPKIQKGSQPIVPFDREKIYANDAAQLTWVGHATFLLQYSGVNILTDPVFSDRASPISFLGPSRLTPPALSIEQLPDIDIVLVSHDHYDHLDRASVIALNKKQKQKPPLYIVPLGIGKWLLSLGITKWLELDWWQSIEVPNWKFTAVPVQHFSGRGPRPNNTLWAGWVFGHTNFKTGEKKQFFFAGDTGYSADFKDIGEHFKHIDVAMIPIGAYEPRWFMKDVHVNPEEAVKIHLDVKSQLSIAMHWGSFPLTDEPLEQPVKDLALAKLKYQIPEQDFITVQHGQQLQLT